MSEFEQVVELEVRSSSASLSVGDRSLDAKSVSCVFFHDEHTYKISSFPSPLTVRNILDLLLFPVRAYSIAKVNKFACCLSCLCLMRMPYGDYVKTNNKFHWFLSEESQSL